MSNEINTIISNLREVLHGQPWYGKSADDLLKEVHEEKAYSKPNNNSHCLMDLIYHMVTWASFAQKRIEKETIADMKAFDETDWRTIDPAVHTWQGGCADLQHAHTRIIELLQTKEDSFLDEKCDYRNYNFRYLLNGLVQHNIYHLAQIAYLNKLLA